MSTKSSSKSSHPKTPIVVVQANDTRLKFSSPPDQEFGAFNEHDTQMLTNEGLVAIWTNTTMRFNFTGTGIAVVGLTQNSSFPPVPTNLLPSFNCMVDDHRIGPSDSHHHKSLTQSNDTSEIPADGKQTLCRTKDLPNQNHTLIVDVTVSTVPAFIDSVRFRPYLANNGSKSFNFTDTMLRIDSHDTSHITFDNGSWAYDHGVGDLYSGHRGNHNGLHSGGFMNITIPSAQVRKLEWYGYADYVDHDRGKPPANQPLQVFLNGNLTEVPLDLSKDRPFDGGFLLFRLAMNESGYSQVKLSVPAPHQYKLSLDHLLVTLGVPSLQRLAANSDTMDGSPEKMDRHKVSLAVPIIGGIVGSLVIILVTLSIVRWFEKRRRWRHTWKDSALPSAIQHPATRVSSRSSFSREVVTGDIEYNPEAQKKLEGAFDAGIMEPPQVIVHHADSGYRGLGVISEVPPHYTRM